MSWEQLGATAAEIRIRRETEESTPPAACPNDGEPLEEGPRGELHCRYDGWIWDGGLRP